MDKDFLLDYTRFVDEVTSDASRDAQALSDSLDVIDGFGVSPERVLTARSLVLVQKVVSLQRL